MTPTHFQVGVSSYSCSVIKATACRDDSDISEIPARLPGVLLPTPSASFHAIGCASEIMAALRLALMSMNTCCADRILVDLLDYFQ